MAAVRRFYASRDDLRPTPLRSLPALARELGLADLRLKDESLRFGLPAFKIVGVAYAIHQLMSDGRLRSGDVVCCATTGNHGRAVARVARERGLRSRVYVPAVTVRARIDAIAAEGADVVVHEGTYEAAVARIADAAAREGWTIVSDTTWPGATSDEAPRLIMAGYTRIFDEAAAAWDAPPDVMFVQAGVGGLLAAAAAWATTQKVASCEPSNAACVLAAARAGRPVTLDGPRETTMAGLRCAEVSHAAWPVVAARVDAFVTVDDSDAFQAMRRLARPFDGDPAVVAGPSGACGLAAVMTIMREPTLAALRAHLKLGAGSRALVINTEGNTDPELYDDILRRG
jgi:diaminopropionate ammonia-lyase